MIPGAGIIDLRALGNLVAPFRPLPRTGSGRRSLMQLHRKIATAAARGYDIHKIGAKTRARMARFDDAVERFYGLDDEADE